MGNCVLYMKHMLKDRRAYACVKDVPHGDNLNFQFCSTLNPNPKPETLIAWALVRPFGLKPPTDSKYKQLKIEASAEIRALWTRNLGQCCGAILAHHLMLPALTATSRQLLGCGRLQ